MKIQPITGPAQIPVNGTPEHVRTARAVAAFNNASQGTAGEQPAQQVVQNQSAVSVEELGAIQPKLQEPEAVDKSATTEATQDVEAKQEQDPALSRQFAQLARQERALRAKAQQQEQAYKQRMAALDAREAAAKAQAVDTSQYIPKARLKQATWDVLTEEGISYDEITQQAIARQSTDPLVMNTIQQLKAEISELRQANSDNQKSQEQRQTEAYQAAVKQIKTDARQLVHSDPNFETIKATNSVNDVVELITETYNKDGILLSVEEAAQEVENYLVEEGLKLANINKIKSRLQQSNASATKATQKPQANNQQPQSMKTLTNATSSTRKLSAKERAILAFKGELKG